MAINFNDLYCSALKNLIFFSLKKYIEICRCDGLHVAELILFVFFLFTDAVYINFMKGINLILILLLLDRSINVDVLIL
ncbi:hypothetical protein SDC9_177133 [bioreactor metagenome]|uniref:Uncharacterized protein n=1 Tax=bioreactor metagenome TaxID=1076179 RepID=A0A645GTP1_9ZZZZ